eukprot:gene15157-20417_t
MILFSVLLITNLILLVKGFHKIDFKLAHSRNVEKTRQTIQDEINIAVSRRNTASLFLKPLLKSKLNKKNSIYSNESKNSMENSISEQGLSTNALIATFVLTAAVFTLRIGGRSALLQVLGLDFFADLGIKQNVSDFVSMFHNLEAFQLPCLFGAWFLAKLICWDWITILLAIASGVLFDDVIQGTMASVVCSSTASFILFYLTRINFRDRVLKDIDNRPLIRAVDRSLQKDGFKTVFTLRLSPVLPIPIGAYNYLYAVTSVKTFDFISGISLASIKPYLLDCYIGIIGRETILSKSEIISPPSTVPLNGDVLLVGGILLLVLVGTISTQIASTLWKEIQTEIKSFKNHKIEINNINNVNNNESSKEEMDVLELLGVNENELPEFISIIKREFDGAWKSMKNLIGNE